MNALEDEEHDSEYWWRQLTEALRREDSNFKRHESEGKAQSQERLGEIAASIESLKREVEKLKDHRRRNGIWLAALAVCLGISLLWLSARSGYHVKVVPSVSSATGTHFEGSATQSLWDQLSEVFGTALIVVATVEAAAQIVSHRFFGAVELEMQTWLRVHLGAIEIKVFELFNRLELTRRLQEVHQAHEASQEQIDKVVSMEETRDRYRAYASFWSEKATETGQHSDRQEAETFNERVERMDRDLASPSVDRSSVAYLIAKHHAVWMEESRRQEQDTDELLASIPFRANWLSGESAGRLLAEVGIELRRRT